MALLDYVQFKCDKAYIDTNQIDIVLNRFGVSYLADYSALITGEKGKQYFNEAKFIAHLNPEIVE